MAASRSDIHAPGGPAPSLPTIDRDHLVPLVHFNQHQASHYLGLAVPKQFFIGDALALLKSRGRDDVGQHLREAARAFARSVQAKGLDTLDTPDSTRLVQYYLTLFALSIGTPISIVDSDGREVAAQLADAYIQSNEIVLRYRTEDGAAEKSEVVADPENLRLKNGARAWFETRFVEEMPPRWAREAAQCMRCRPSLDALGSA